MSEYVKRLINNRIRKLERQIEYDFRTKNIGYTPTIYPSGKTDLDYLKEELYELQNFLKNNEL